MPTRTDAVIFAFKATCFRLRRALRDLVRADIRRWTPSDSRLCIHPWAEARSDLRTDDTAEQRELVLGKIENLRVALRAINGVELPAGATFSFWRQVGRATSLRGYVPGRELREGCIVPAIGGGICQLSNALYQAAADAGLEIVERHAHSQVIPGSAAAIGRDATVFWNYVDLRFRSDQPCRIEVVLERTELVVRILKQQPRRRHIAVEPVSAPAPAAGRTPNSCDSCDAYACFRRIDPATIRQQSRTAYLLDAVWPEFDRWVQASLGAHDSLFVPLDGKAWNKPQYGWTTAGFETVTTFPLFTLRRALASRRLTSQGAARQQSALLFRERLARLYASRLDYRIDHLVVAQDLLPFLWKLGVLQGRTVDVLMSAMPMRDMQAQLDAAFARNPASRTLGDFRAHGSLPALEAQALRYARQIVTPHTSVAASFAGAVLLSWTAPPARAHAGGKKIVFPAATLGRKGAYELREAARTLGLRLMLAGPDLESGQFWDGVEVERMPLPDAHALKDAAVVVLPAWVENRPARLLQALQWGIPVIASTACGLPEQANLTLVAAGDSAALTDALRPYV